MFDVFVGRKVISTAYSTAILKVLLFDIFIRAQFPLCGSYTWLIRFIPKYFIFGNDTVFNFHFFIVSI